MQGSGRVAEKCLNDAHDDDPRCVSHHTGGDDEGRGLLYDGVEEGTPPPSEPGKHVLEGWGLSLFLTGGHDASFLGVEDEVERVGGFEIDVSDPAWVETLLNPTSPQALHLRPGVVNLGTISPVALEVPREAEHVG
jgi:hypothetical protein